MKLIRPGHRQTAILVAGLTLSWILATLLSRYMLTQMYEGNSWEFLSSLLTNRGEKPLQYYLGLLTAPIAASHLLLLLVGAMFLTRHREDAWLLLALLLGGDCMLLGFSEVYDWPFLDIIGDWTLPEFYQYSKELFLAVLFVAVFRERGERVFLFFAAVAAYLFFDDAFRYHETGGRFLAPYVAATSLPELLGSEPNYIGEILSLTPLLALVPLGASSYFRSDSTTRWQATVLGVLLFMLFMFGVAVDFLPHSSAGLPQWLESSIPVIEDFGEMVTMSLMLAYAGHLRWSSDRSGAFPGADRVSPHLGGCAKK